MARWAEDDDFNGWVAALRGGEASGQSGAIDPATMKAEIPDIPIAGTDNG